LEVFGSSSSRTPSGTQNWQLRMISRPRKAGGATPTTVKGCPDRRTVLPTMAGSAAKRRRQRPWPRTMTSRFSSSRLKPRPTVRGSSVTSKKFAVTACPQTR
jgi:hypothetical protein